MKPTRLRLWIRKYGDAGVLFAGGCLAAHHLWTRRRTALIAAFALLTASASLMLWAHHPGPRHHNIPALPTAEHFERGASLFAAAPSVDLLEKAAAMGRNEDCLLLLANGADVNAINHRTDSNALIAAVENHHPDTASLLIAHGANINECTQFATPLHSAAEGGNLGMVELLVAHGADVNLHDGIGTVLENAIGHPDVVRFLLRHGAAVDKPGKYDTTPLLLASANGDLASVNILLQHGAGINYISERQGATPLESAAANGHVQVVKALLRWGANVNLRTERNDIDTQETVSTSALQEAKKAGHADIMRLLKRAGARE